MLAIVTGQDNIYSVPEYSGGEDLVMLGMRFATRRDQDVPRQESASR